ncbi:MAG TPA: CRTAC1 family protein [Verrucomicrobiae bacterium]|nr:CRTAC1 family protein [Verrucomicrobiae bacterium]
MTGPGPSSSHDDPLRPDDVLIGRAFRWSVFALAMLAAGGGAVWYFKTRPETRPVQITPLVPPALPERLAAEIPRVNFSDITTNAGIGFVHENGAQGDKLLPETMGGGVAFLDFDNDGDQDLFFVNSTLWPWHKPDGRAAGTLALYRNDGAGHFAEVTAGSGLDVSLYGMGVAVGDYDNDGLPDVFVTAVGGNHLFRNLGGGRFADVTASAGVGGAPDQWSTSAAWVDVDNDGDLDLFVCNYVRWSREIDLRVNYRLTGIGRAYGPPANFEGTFPYLYRNDGGGRFTDVSAASGVQVRNPATGAPLAKSLSVAPVDANNDGWIDLVVANDTVQNFLFTNRHDGTFAEVGARAGVAFDAYGLARGAMGIDSARFRNDDALGIAIGNFANEMNALYVSQRDTLIFADEAITEGVGPASRLLLKFGLFFFDYDLDGRLDVLTANGHLEEQISLVQSSQRYRQPAQLFWNRGGARGMSFVPVPAQKAGEEIFQPIVGRGSAYADIDGDGDLDVVLTQIGGRPLLLRNDQQLGNRWLRLKLIGTRCNRDAIGAWIKVRVGAQTLSRQVMPTRSYLSQSELPVTIGLGNAARPDAVEILWPDGSRQKLDAVPLGQTTVVEQPR